MKKSRIGDQCVERVFEVLIKLNASLGIDDSITGWT
jgi:hypothetical protein